jgi:hypothetical protein
VCSSGCLRTVAIERSGRLVGVLHVKTGDGIPLHRKLYSVRAVWLLSCASANMPALCTDHMCGGAALLIETIERNIPEGFMAGVAASGIVCICLTSMWVLTLAG